MDLSYDVRVFAEKEYADLPADEAVVKLQLLELHGLQPLSIVQDSVSTLVDVELEPLSGQIAKGERKYLADQMKKSLEETPIGQANEQLQQLGSDTETCFNIYRGMVEKYLSAQIRNYLYITTGSSNISDFSYEQIEMAFNLYAFPSLTSFDFVGMCKDWLLEDLAKKRNSSSEYYRAVVYMKNFPPIILRTVDQYRIFIELLNNENLMRDEIGLKSFCGFPIPAQISWLAGMSKKDALDEIEKMLLSDD